MAIPLILEPQYIYEHSSSNGTLYPNQIDGENSYTWELVSENSNPDHNIEYFKTQSNSPLYDIIKIEKTTSGIEKFFYMVYNNKLSNLNNKVFYRTYSDKPNEFFCIFDPLHIYKLEGNIDTSLNKDNINNNIITIKEVFLSTDNNQNSFLVNMFTRDISDRKLNYFNFDSIISTDFIPIDKRQFELIPHLDLSGDTRSNDFTNGYVKYVFIEKDIGTKQYILGKLYNRNTWSGSGIFDNPSDKNPYDDGETHEENYVSTLVVSTPSTINSIYDINTVPDSLLTSYNLIKDCTSIGKLFKAGLTDNDTDVEINAANSTLDEVTFPQELIVESEERQYLSFLTLNISNDTTTEEVVINDDIIFNGLTYTLDNFTRTINETNSYTSNGTNYELNTSLDYSTEINFKNDNIYSDDNKLVMFEEIYSGSYVTEFTHTVEGVDENITYRVPFNFTIKHSYQIDEASPHPDDTDISINIVPTKPEYNEGEDIILRINIMGSEINSDKISNRLFVIKYLLDLDSNSSPIERTLSIQGTDFIELPGFIFCDITIPATDISINNNNIFENDRKVLFKILNVETFREV